MEHIMNISPNEVYFTASDIGWVVGHTYVSFMHISIIVVLPFTKSRLFTHLY